LFLVRHGRAERHAGAGQQLGGHQASLHQQVGELVRGVGFVAVRTPVSGEHRGERLGIARRYDDFIAFHHGHLQCCR
jgi:hypothetical protein